MGNTMKQKHRTVRKLKQIGAIGFSALLVAGTSLFFATNSAKAAACAPPATDYGTASSTVNVGSAASYSIWSQMFVPDTTNNSYLLEVDGTSCFVVGDSGITPNTWTWVNYQNGNTASKITLNLTAGNHAVKMIGREPSVQLGRILFLSDAGCVPAGNGSNCTIAEDTTPPAVSVSAPAAGASVSGTANITANATDNTGVLKVEFYINGALVSTSTNSPYTYSWNTKTSANGPVNLAVKAYDAAGNATTSDTVQVTVNNVTPGDTQAPSVPTDVSAVAEAYNKVSVKWSASTDNVGVTGYVLSRNNIPLANVTDTQYTDTSVLPGTRYTYQVSAYDAAKNNSAASSVATVTTPTASTEDTQAPSAPRQLRAQANSETQINLNWRAATDNIGVAAYDVYRSQGNNSATKIATVTSTSYGDTGLAASTKYSYFVKARDAAGNVSVQSNTDSETTRGKPSKQQFSTLKGTVKYSGSKKSRPTVTIRFNGHRHVFAVNSRGKYAIPRLPVGQYDVTYSARGAKAQTITIQVVAGKATIQNVTLH